MSPLELSECTLWNEGPTWSTEDEELENEIQKSVIKNPKFEIWKRQFGLFTDEHGIVDV